jgi:hypothetical protein
MLISNELLRALMITDKFMVAGYEHGYTRFLDLVHHPIF